MIDSKSEKKQEVIFTNGEWLEKTLQQLRRPDEMKKTTIPENVKAELRPDRVESMLENVDVKSKRIIQNADLLQIFGVE